MLKIHRSHTKVYQIR